MYLHFIDLKFLEYVHLYVFIFKDVYFCTYRKNIYTYACLYICVYIYIVTPSKTYAFTVSHGIAVVWAPFSVPENNAKMWFC